ncbi:MAG: hypothetical protein M3Y89_14280 [Actinomycetota bacterium]|nr:hypothetical protein [Actinomycetota bacterium]
MALHDGEPQVRKLLGGVEHIGRDALEEFRVILGLLPDVVSPLPSELTAGNAGLDQLIEAMRSAGLPLTVRGTAHPASVPQALRETVFRVVQEGLTNALKHANAATTTLDITLDASSVVVWIRDRGQVGSRSFLPSGGNGLVGVRERVHALGGVVDCGPSRVMDGSCGPSCRSAPRRDLATAWSRR